jgi:acetyl-CoA C-acetyltransferase
MDEVALRSHNNAERATNDGSFAEEIVPVPVPRRKKDPLIFDKDEHFRPGLTLEQLQKLPPAFVPKTGKVTAGNASGINDGAAAMVIMSAEKAKARTGLTPWPDQGRGPGRLPPGRHGAVPGAGGQDLLKRSGLAIADFELVEVNEAFAAQYIGCERELGLNREITNVNGSGIGLGHPVGATGCRIMVTLLHALKQRGKSLGLATLCGGGGVSMACAIGNGPPRKARVPGEDLEKSRRPGIYRHPLPGEILRAGHWACMENILVAEELAGATAPSAPAC